MYWKAQYDDIYCEWIEDDRFRTYNDYELDEVWQRHLKYGDH